MSEPRCYPDLIRPDVGCVVTSAWYVGTRERQRAAADAAIDMWKKLPWPQECISLNCYLSTDGKLVWFYGQWTSEEAHREFTRTQRPLVTDGVDQAVPNIQRMGVVRSRLHHSISGGPDLFPGIVVLVTIATDGPERQLQAEETIRTRVIAGDESPHAGAIGAHIHFSTDGTRVLLYAEWTSEAAHRDAVESGVLGGKRGLFDGVPHIEGFGFDRYTLYRRLARP